MKIQHLSVLALFALSLQACDKEATGQVAAVINGDEITLQEVNAEMGNAQIPDGADKKSVQQAALQRILERRLLSQAAENEGLDKTPEFLLRERQLRDALLVQMMGQKAERSQKVPSQQEIDRYMANNPVMFGDRKIFSFDRIQFPVPGDVKKLQALENDHSMAAVADRLKQMGIDFQRDTAQVDSASLGQERLDQIRALPAGEPFVVVENGLAIVGVITGERDAAVGGADARPMAVQAIRNDELNKAMQQRLSQAKAEADIEYQPEFAPPTSNKAPSAQAK